MQNVLAEIRKILDWYKVNCKTAFYIDILSAKDRLAIYSFTLAEFTADMKGEYNLAYFNRRISVLRTKQTLINSKTAIGKAEGDAILEHQDAYKKEMEAEADAYRADLLLRQVNKIIDAMQQRVSVLRSEMDKSQKIQM